MNHKFTIKNNKYTGIFIPVSALRTEQSCGVGDFGDIISLGEFAHECSLDIIQILPVNDTGTDSSPYNAISSLALHPLYLNLDQLYNYYKEKLHISSNILNTIQLFRSQHASDINVQYHAVLAGKKKIAYEIFQIIFSQGLVFHEQIHTQLLKWIKKNNWVTEYAVFAYNKDKNQQQSWIQWSETQQSHDYAHEIWNETHANNSELFFYAWLQFHLEQQLVASAHYLQTLHIALKGDIPVLLNEDSVDVWLHKDIFHTNLHAGAPPDGENPIGQNWGFPTYNWKTIADSNYHWWQQRLEQANKFYQLYRLDHILGFYRLWIIDKHNKSGELGYFSPEIGFSLQDFAAIGLDSVCIFWLSEPHIKPEDLYRIFGDATQRIIDCALKLLTAPDGHEVEELYLFDGNIYGEESIYLLPISEQQQQALIELYRDRCFLHYANGTYHFTHYFYKCSRFSQLSDHQKNVLFELHDNNYKKNNLIWQEQGTRILQNLIKHTPMLPCGEDLGMIPEFMPESLNKLGILGLRVIRWVRNWHESEQPWLALEHYPQLSVLTTSVHDSSTMRIWWENELTDHERALFWNRLLNFTDNAPARLSSASVERIYSQLFTAHAALRILPLIDMLLLDDKFYVNNPETERINVPGTVNDTNWSYRLPFTLEDLKKHTSLIKKIQILSTIQ